MKKLLLLGLSVFLMAACSSTKQSAYRTQWNASQTPQIQPSAPETGAVPGMNPYQNTGIGPAVIPNQNMGIGPVNIAASNFYFAGNFQLENGVPVFYDCLAGTNLPIATDQGVYADVLKRYREIAPTGESVYVKMRGFTIPNPDKTSGAYPYKLVISYLNGMQTHRSCNPLQTLVGNWSASLVGAHPGTAYLYIGNDFSFNLEVKTNSQNYKLNGSWNLTGAEELYFFYKEEMKYMGHESTINPNTMTIFLPTPSGTLILKKEP